MCLRQVGMRPEDYLKNRGQVAIRQQIIEAVSDGLKAPDAFLKAVALYRGEDRTADYIVLAASLVEPIEDPAADVLAKWFDGEKKNYAAPEYRKIGYVKLDRRTTSPMRRRSATTRSRRTTTRTRAKYTTPETRTDRAARVQDAGGSQGGARDSITQRLDASRTSSRAKARRWPMSSSARSTKDKIPDPAVADAAFKLKSNEVSEVVQGAFGPVLVRVTDVTPEVVRPLDEVKDEIRKDLALGEANRILLDVHDKYEDARAGWCNRCRRRPAKLKLKMVTIDAIDRSARGRTAAIVNDLPESQELLRRRFDTEVGIENPAHQHRSRTGFVFYEVGRSRRPATARSMRCTTRSLPTGRRPRRQIAARPPRPPNCRSRSRTAAHARRRSPPSSSSRSRPSAE